MGMPLQCRPTPLQCRPMPLQYRPMLLQGAMRLHSTMVPMVPHWPRQTLVVQHLLVQTATSMASQTSWRDCLPECTSFRLVGTSVLYAEVLALPVLYAESD